MILNSGHYVTRLCSDGARMVDWVKPDRTLNGGAPISSLDWAVPMKSTIFVLERPCSISSKPMSIS